MKKVIVLICMSSILMSGCADLVKVEPEEEFQKRMAIEQEERDNKLKNLIVVHIKEEYGVEIEVTSLTYVSISGGFGGSEKYLDARVLETGEEIRIYMSVDDEISIMNGLGYKNYEKVDE